LEAIVQSILTLRRSIQQCRAPLLDALTRQHNATQVFEFGPSDVTLGLLDCVRFHVKSEDTEWLVEQLQGNRFVEEYLYEASRGGRSHFVVGEKLIGDDMAYWMARPAAWVPEKMRELVDVLCAILDRGGMHNKEGFTRNIVM